jgi:hypothetical protein
MWGVDLQVKHPVAALSHVDYAVAWQRTDPTERLHMVRETLGHYARTNQN